MELLLILGIIVCVFLMLYIYAGGPKNGIVFVFAGPVLAVVIMILVEALK